MTLAVSEAEQQLAELRNHVDILKGDVKILAPRAFERAFDSQPYDAVTSGGSYPPSVRDSAPQSDAAGANPEFVESLSEQQAKVLLQVGDLKDVMMVGKLILAFIGAHCQT